MGLTVVHDGVFGNLPLEALKDRWAFAGRDGITPIKSCEDATEQIPFDRKQVTSMIGNSQGETEIPLDLAEGVLPTGKALA